VLIYSAITSLDGYVNDEGGGFDWAMPSAEEHAFVNDLERGVRTYLYGRRMYEVMRYWENPPPESSAIERDYAAIWQAADKVVYSTTLEEVTTTRTRLQRTFDPDDVRALLDAGDLSVGGPGLAASAFRAGLLDEVHLFLHPVLVGGGTRALPDGVRLDLVLLDEDRFRDGVVHLHYGVRHRSASRHAQIVP
jgi:dihydrofolate reductase